MTRTALALRALVSVFVLVACGTDNELVPLDDGLLESAVVYAEVSRRIVVVG